jgi:hypothetical protein
MGEGDGAGRGGLVVVGGSAGSHPALLSLVAGLPADLPAAVLVVIHIGAQASSRLPQILSRAASLPAAHATDGALLRNGEIVVAPPGRHLLVEDGRIRLGAEELVFGVRAGRSGQRPGARTYRQGPNARPASAIPATGPPAAGCRLRAWTIRRPRCRGRGGGRPGAMTVTALTGLPAR